MMLLSLLGVIGLIFLTYFAARWLNKRTTMAGTRSIKILERANFSQDKSIVIVKVGGKLMLLGVTSEHIERIADLDETDITVPEAPPQNGTFLENLKKATREHPYIKPFIKAPQGEQQDDRVDE